MRFAFFLLAGLLACDSDATLVMLQVDLAPSLRTTSVDVEIEVRSADGESTTQRERVAGTAFPLCLAVVPRGGDANRTFQATARVFVGGEVVAETEVDGFFDEGVARTMPLRLEEGCLSAACDAGMTCGAGGCTAARRPALLPFDEEMCSPQSPDAGVEDACMPVEEICNSDDDDCDGVIDEDCRADCEAGTADCDDDPTTCETDATTNDNCGGCGIVCGELQRCVDNACAGPSLEWSRSIALSDAIVALDDDAIVLAGVYETATRIDEVDLPEPERFDAVVGRLDAERGTFSRPWYVRGPRSEFVHDLSIVGDRVCLGGSSTSVGSRPTFDGQEMATLPRDFHPYFGCSDGAGGAWVSTQITASAHATAENDVFVGGRGDPPNFGDPLPGRAVGFGVIDERTGTGRWSTAFAFTPVDDFDSVFVSDVDARDGRACALLRPELTPSGTFTYEGEAYEVDDDDTLVTCYDVAERAHLWTVHLRGNGSERGRHIAVVDDGGVVVGGVFDADLEVGDEAVRATGTATNAFLLGLTNEGAVRWLRTFPGMRSAPTDLIDLSAGDDIVYAIGAGPTFLDVELSTDVDLERTLGALDPLTGDTRWARLFRGSLGLLRSSEVVAHGDRALVVTGVEGVLTVGGVELATSDDIFTRVLLFLGSDS
ncbi:MAG: hypothetical protein AAGE52_34180 [Myxococcota bacterium]